MSVFSEESDIIVTCPRGLSAFLTEEITECGFLVTRHSPTSVHTKGTLSDAMMLNLRLRTGYRVLYHLKTFTARTPDDLYRHVFSVPWEKYIPIDGYFSVLSSVETPLIRDTRIVALKAKDAVADRMMKRYGARPNSGSDRDGVVLFVFWRGNNAGISLDTSGEPLSRRGYRRISGSAPLQESLAAALIHATGWTGSTPFVNPMCGSGTLAIEAALIARGRAPGLSRDNFAFMHLRHYPRAEWNALRKAALHSLRDGPLPPIIASDHNEKALASARENARSAGVEDCIDFSLCHFADTAMPREPGIVILNPEYGKRMGDEKKLRDTYHGIGDFLKQHCPGYRGFIFTGNRELAKYVGLKTSRRTPFFNGAIECRLLEYRIYAGSENGGSPSDSV